MSGFPFFYLPLLAFENIFKLMDLETLYYFSRQSTKCKTILKRYFRHRKFQFSILVNFSNMHSVIISCDLFDHSFPFFCIENQDDGFPVLEEAIDRISNFFSPPNDMIDLEIWNKGPEDISKTLIASEKWNLKLNEVMISSSCSRVDRVLEQILKASKDASVVRIYCEISANLRVPEVIQFNSKVERMELKHAKWVTRHNLADIFWKVELLTFGETNFQKSDFIWFFTKWVEGSIIQNAKLPLNGFALEDWIENVPTAMRTRIRFYSPKSEEDSVEYETYTIRQASGHVAVLLEGNGFVYLSTKHFQLL